MSIAVIGDGWWRSACDAAGEDVTTLPLAVEPSANPYSADAKARTAVGVEWLEAVRSAGASAVIDNGGAGLAFVRDTDDPSTIALFHERADVPLISHCVDPIVTIFQSLVWPAVWQCLQSDTWFKFVWDKPQAMELDAFGVPRVHHMPMAAPDRDYDTTPLSPDGAEHAVSFVGGQNTTYFGSQNNVSAATLLAGTFAQAVRSDMPDVCFYDVFFDLYRLMDPPMPGEPVETRMKKALEYFNHKLFYNATLCIKQRDRFVVFLKRKLGETFALFGNRWDSAYGLSCHPQLPTADAYFNHFRKAAINLNFVNGNADSGLNMRHFEITAAGGFLLCYHQPEINDMFEVGRECDTFHNEQELLEKIRYYLEHPDKRIEIALAGQRRTLSDHLYSHRLRSMLDTVRSSSQILPVTPAGSAPSTSQQDPIYA